MNIKICIKYIVAIGLLDCCKKLGNIYQYNNYYRLKII